MKDGERRVRALHELPEAIEPPRDLWPAIEARLHASTLVRRRITSTQQALSAWRWAAAAALAVLGVALGVGLWQLSGRLALPEPERGTPAMAQVLRGPHASTPVRGTTPVMDEDDAAAREALLRALNARLSGLPVPTQQKVRADLQVIEQSIQDIQSALGRDPGNALLHELLRETEQDEQHLAATVREAGAWIEEARGGPRREGS